MNKLGPLDDFPDCRFRRFQNNVIRCSGDVHISSSVSKHPGRVLVSGYSFHPTTSRSRQSAIGQIGHLATAEATGSEALSEELGPHPSLPLTTIMPFFKDLRRKKIGLRHDQSPEGSKRSDHSRGSVPTAKSSSTLNSLYGSSTPPSSIQPQSSNPNLLNGKSVNGINVLSQRSNPLGSSSNRNSYMVCL